MAAAIYIFAIVAAATAGFVLAYLASGLGVLVSLAIGYLAGSLAALAIVAVLMLLASKPKDQAAGVVQGNGRVSPKQPRS